MKIKRVFLDMDGTLLNSQGQVSKRNARLIRRANLPVTLISARAPMEMSQAIDTLDLTDLQVGFNGGLIYRLEKGRVQPIYSQVMAQKDVQYLLNYIRQHFPQVSLSYYDLNNWYCDKIDEGIRYEHSLTGQGPTFIQDEARFLKAPINIFKIMMISFDQEEIQALERTLRQLGMASVSIQRSGKAYLEITHIKAKKSAGLTYIFEKEKLSKENTAAFGDGHNDLPMLNRVAYPIVMNNALAEIKKVAYRVTKSNDEDGVGYGIQKYLVKI
ncbi:HAD family hydrolase [Streptococcus oricebi]|uniref:HAD family hydrolase n=1 Tax=Streptococcus oricebi TaxID=1547447 RepID=A0ABS5B2H1_9STRE|nr:HAD family hydrolase [Streptococcus oricebi]MBP2623024.1 HAD family hydrolase [Streptococcus oricebi]